MYLNHCVLIWVKRRYHKVKFNMNTKAHYNNSCPTVSSALSTLSQGTLMKSPLYLEIHSVSMRSSIYHNR